MPTALNLELVETDQLLTELGKRFNCFVFTAAQYSDDDEDWVKSCYHGSASHCLGLAQVMLTDLMSHIQHYRETVD